MRHYIDAEKLKAEIERLIQNLRGIAVDNPMLAQTMRLSFEGLLSFIDSLQQEYPEVDFGKEIFDTCRRYWIRGNFDVAELDKHDIENIARHFYELGFNARVV